MTRAKTTSLRSLVDKRRKKELMAIDIDASFYIQSIKQKGLKM
jgi:hypothetical protein